MTPEAGRYLEKARRCLAHARAILGIALGEEAGRSAYLTAFHAAQALIFERLGTVARSHQGVHGEFAKLAKNEPSIDPDLRRFLSQAYDLKVLADYETGPEAVVPLERAAAAVDAAERFLDCVAQLVERSAPATPGKSPIKR